MKKSLLTILALLVSNIIVWGQTCTADPAVFTAFDKVTFTLDVSGNTQLENLNQAWIWAWDPSKKYGPTTNIDPATAEADAAKWTKKDGNIWEISFVPKEFLNVPDGKEGELKKLGLLLKGRSWDDGKTQDFLFDVAQAGELSMNLLSPSGNGFNLLEKGESLKVKASANESVTWTLSLSNNKITESTGKNFDFDLTVAEDFVVGEFALTATKGDKSVERKFTVVLETSSPTAELPSGLREGVNYHEDNSKATLVLLAPKKKFVYAIGDFNDWKVSADFLMNKTPDGERFWITLDGLVSKKEYVFQYLVDGSIRIADPFTDKVSDPRDDKYIGDDIYPNLIDYPEGKTEFRASVLQTGQEPFEWKAENFQKPEKEDLIIYEVLVRDWVADHKYSTVADSLDYLKDMGVNAIHFMPFSEFEGNISWGYNPNFYFAPDKYYGTKDDLKRLIDACHEKGIAVIMDLVLNHSFHSSPLLRLYQNQDTNAPASDNPWYNVESPNQAYKWGVDFDHESKYTQAFVDSVNRYWIEEYKVDGFRFDFTKGFTNTPGDGWAYDQARIDLLKRMADKIWEKSPKAYVILEHLADNKEETELADYGMMLWGNMNGAYRNLSKGENSDIGWQFFNKRGWSKPGLISYMESHDEERLMYDAITHGKKESAYNIKNLNTALSRMKMLTAFHFLPTGPKMIWQFGELGYGHSIDLNGRTGEKPVEWGYFKEAPRKRLYDSYATIIALSKDELFSDLDPELNVAGTVKEIRFQSGDDHAVLIGNFGTTIKSVTKTLPTTDGWKNILTGEAVSLNGNQFATDLWPGQFVLLSNKDLGVNVSPEVFDIAPAIAGALENIEGEVSEIDRVISVNALFQDLADGDQVKVELLSNTNSELVNVTVSPSGNMVIKHKEGFGETTVTLRGKARYAYTDREFKIKVNPTLTDVDDPEEAGISLYPIPVTDELRIDVPSNVEVKNVELLDANGKRLLTADFQDRLGKIKLGGFVTGIYYLRITTTDAVYTKRLLKK
ncbi:hypothetical protein FUAX_22010 [Fulvitalea axinellae]|uniref:Glycosyl hydrolase family 13 catalytic domain-containing protein n=1 Tax=Fulvitalea axinellae TaxID=1182444 RepID=A0AAU9D5L3_9BACT|nr:hypothetical protein FUAX_22010 [Fulvitalea axinellae]